MKKLILAAAVLATFSFTANEVANWGIDASHSRMGFTFNHQGIAEMQGEFKKGSKERPTVVFECACDSDLFIWHCFFALPGACSDINVLDVSPLLFSIASGKTMTEFHINGSLMYQPYVVHLY